MTPILYIILCTAGEPCTVTAVQMPDWPTCFEAPKAAAVTGPGIIFCGSDKYAPKKWFTTEKQG